MGDHLPAPDVVKELHAASSGRLVLGKKKNCNQFIIK
jgi:hypothetical protein